MIEGQQSRYLELVECFRLDCLARQLCRFIDEVAPKMVLNKIARKASQVRDLTIISQFHSNNNRMAYNKCHITWVVFDTFY